MDEFNAITGEIIGSAIEVHRNLGPGLLESAYEACLLWELRQKGMNVQVQVPVPINYKGLAIDAGYRMDFLVEAQVVVELKTVEKLLPVHTAQVLTYLKMANLRIALLLNFNVAAMLSGIRRIRND
jgi:GxxExxY protein